MDAPLTAILGGISQKLNETFGDEYTIYLETMKQGLTRPCFFIELLKPSSKKERDTTYRRNNLYCIHFFPKDTSQPISECYQMLDTLYLALEYIEVGGNLVRGTGMLGEIQDDILKFHINFNVRVRKIPEFVTMETLQTELQTKG